MQVQPQTLEEAELKALATEIQLRRTLQIYRLQTEGDCHLLVSYPQ